MIRLYQSEINSIYGLSNNNMNYCEKIARFRKTLDLSLDFKFIIFNGDKIDLKYIGTYYFGSKPDNISYVNYSEDMFASRHHGFYIILRAGFDDFTIIYTFDVKRKKYKITHD